MTSRRDDDEFPPGFEPGTAPVTGILPAVPPGAHPDKNPRNNAATAASAAGIRALSAQVIAFYFRAPVKAFFRTRVDYLAWARTVHQTHTELRAAQLSAEASKSDSRLRNGLRTALAWARGTTPGVVTSAVQHYGWGVLPNQILPPLIANVGVGAVLYTSYLQILGRLHEESSKATKMIYPPPEPIQTFTAGLLAGALQSVVAAPLDAIQARFDHRDIMPSDGKGKPRSMWAFSAEKLREIGLRGIFAGFGLSLVKDSVGSAVFFSTFEYVKAQSYYRFVTWYYGDLNEDIVNLLATRRPTRTASGDGNPLVIRPHYSIEPMFLLLAGITASFAQQVVLHPLTHFQVEHWDRLEELDEKAAKLRRIEAEKIGSGEAPKQRQTWRMFRAYYNAYQETWAHCASSAASEGRTVRHWLYRGFWWNTIRQVPSTSAGLIIFELFRRKYGLKGDEIRINRDGYDILFN